MQIEKHARFKRLRENCAIDFVALTESFLLTLPTTETERLISHHPHLSHYSIPFAEAILFPPKVDDASVLLSRLSAPPVRNFSAFK
jgi:hypothetical protein